MRFALTGTVLLAYISLATSHVIRRDISIVLRGLSTLNANIGTFGASIYRYDGTLPAAIEIFHQESNLEKDLEGVATDTNSTAEWTAQESNSVTESLVGLEPIMRTSIAALVMKVGTNPETSLFLGDILTLLTAERSLHRRRRGQCSAAQSGEFEESDSCSFCGAAGQGRRC